MSMLLVTMVTAVASRYVVFYCVFTNDNHIILNNNSVYMIISITYQQCDRLYGSLVYKSIILLLPTREVKPVLTYIHIYTSHDTI